MKVLIYGGSFDPPHREHLRMLAAALRSAKPERAYVVPARRSPLKPGCRASGSDRLAMLGAALNAAFPPSLSRRVSISTFELKKDRPSCTYQTLRHFHRLYPRAELRFLAGSDSLLDFAHWKRPRELRALARFLIARRPGARIRRRGLQPRFDLLPGVFRDVSSTTVRAGLLAGEHPTGISTAVLRYIRSRRLYGLDMQHRLSKELGPSRFRHTMSVARCALDLARRHGMDPERAALAGLLHDCGRAVPVARMAGYARRRRLRVPDCEAVARRHPLLLHSFLSADRARRVYGVRDEAVLGAIRAHTLGSGRMGALERLIYTADLCSDDRSFPEAAGVRRAARTGLNEGYREAVRVKLADVLRRRAWMHPSAPAVWNGALEG